MTVPIDLQSQLPPPSDDEPPELRSDIVDELADHLQCLVIKEQLKAGGDRLTQAEVWQRVIKRFGDPAKVARTLWFQAIGRRLMLQKLALGLNLCVTLAACVGAMVVCYSLQSSVTQMSERVLQLHSLQANVQTQQAQLNKLSTLLERLEMTGLPAGGGAVSGDMPAGGGGGFSDDVPAGMGGGGGPGAAGMGGPAGGMSGMAMGPTPDPLAMAPGGLGMSLTGPSMGGGPSFDICPSGAIPDPRPEGMSVIKFTLVHAERNSDGQITQTVPDTTSVVSVESKDSRAAFMHADSVRHINGYSNALCHQLRTAVFMGSGRFKVTVTTSHGLMHVLSIPIFAGEPRNEEITIVTPSATNNRLDQAAVKFKCSPAPRFPDDVPWDFGEVRLQQLEQPSITIDGRAWLYKTMNYGSVSLLIDRAGNITGYSANDIQGGVQSSSKLSLDDPWVFLDKTAYRYELRFGGVGRGSNARPVGGKFMVTSDQQEIILDLADSSAKGAIDESSKTDAVR